MAVQKSDWEEELKELDAVDFRTNVQESFHQVIKASAAVAVLLSTVSSDKHHSNKTDDLGYGYQDGNQGYGFYFGDILDDD
jgi:hypothetical protein